MTQRAVALVVRPGEPADGAVGASGRVGRTAGSGRRTRRLGPGRPYVLIVVGVVLAIWLVLVFGRALSQLNEANERAAAVRAESAALEARLDAVGAESELVQTDPFMDMQARAYGMGRPGERPFALAPDAPPAPPVVPLGADAAEPSAVSPLESWLRLLLARD